MSSFIIEGGRKLKGEINISGSKNAALPILATAILNPNKVTFYNVPNIEDVRTTIRILKCLGCKVTSKYGKITVCSQNIKNNEIPKELMEKARSTIVLVGALLGRFGKACFYNPGGCNIGERPIDLHLSGFKKLGVTITNENGRIECKTSKLIPNKIYLNIPSVGATENIILTSVLIKGITNIYNPAKEPEIRDLVNCLNKMGAKIYGVGTNKITIIGVEKLKSTSYRIMPDRIEAGTYLSAAAITGGKIKINNVNPQDLWNYLLKLKQTGCKISLNGNSIKLIAPKVLKATNISTGFYPEFPTDLQSIFTTIMCCAKGISIVKENIFENRFLYCEELKKLGANIEKEDNTIKVYGTSKLIGDVVKCNDLRGGASLILAALSAKGITKILNIENVFRGYENIEEKLKKLGANIKKG